MSESHIDKIVASDLSDFCMNEDSPLINGYEIFHNYIRTHEGLDGKTPSEACGIEVNGDNKWITLIQNASRS